jgi:antibiotic biosynthesis monooxygenase (ABM) superfamily enzyme
MSRCCAAARGRRIHTIVSHFASGADADAWLAGEARARLVAEADLHAAGELHTRYLSGLEGWLAGRARRPGAGPARAVEDRAGLSGRDLAVAAWARPLVSVLILIPLMQYAVMPLLTRAARPFLYPARAGQPLKDAL